MQKPASHSLPVQVANSDYLSVASWRNFTPGFCPQFFDRLFRRFGNAVEVLFATKKNIVANDCQRCTKAIVQLVGR